MQRDNESNRNEGNLLNLRVKTDSGTITSKVISRDNDRTQFEIIGSITNRQIQKEALYTCSLLQQLGDKKCVLTNCLCACAQHVKTMMGCCSSDDSGYMCDTVFDIHKCYKEQEGRVLSVRLPVRPSIHKSFVLKSKFVTLVSIQVKDIVLILSVPACKMFTVNYKLFILKNL